MLSGSGFYYPYLSYLALAFLNDSLVFPTNLWTVLETVSIRVSYNIIVHWNSIPILTQLIYM